MQVDVLIGSQGLLPIAPIIDSLAEVDRPVWPGFPTFLLLDASDATIHAGIAVGLLLSLLALVGVWPRACLLLSAPLYLGYVVASRDFLSFQWDNLLIECLVLASFLPRRRPAPGAHWVMRLLLFKLYFESGIAKAQSYLGDWLDGSAMTFYYETAPLPAWPAWWMHHLPETWHQLESLGALGLETAGALLILGPRRARLAALIGFTGFQLLNLATANYGFFVYLALSLHVFLLDDEDVARLARRLPHVRLPGRDRWVARLRAVRLPRRLDTPARVGAGALGVAWIAASLLTAFVHFGPQGDAVDASGRAMRAIRVFRVANAYHLFGHITRERIEPEVQTWDGDGWQAHHLHYKPGDPRTPPPFVAPHQPRVDFRLWFHGLDHQRGAPQYVRVLVERICTEPRSVAPLFPEPLPEHPRAVRIVYWQYHFTSLEERRASGAWWRRSKRGSTSALDCEILQLETQGEARPESAIR